MEQIAWEASPLIPHILWNIIFRFRVHNRPRRVSVLSQINPLKTKRICFI
jgi:hypothetical protein